MSLEEEVGDGQKEKLRGMGEEDSLPVGGTNKSSAISWNGEESFLFLPPHLP